MTHLQDPSDQRTAIKWARRVAGVQHKDHIIIEVETTGIADNDEIIEIAAISMEGETLLHTRLKPTIKKSISKGAADVHGILMEDLEDAPKFADIADQLREITNAKTIISYSAAFDDRLLTQTQIAANLYWATEWHCAIEEYAEFYGELKYQYGSYKREKEKIGNGSALDGCHATLNMIKRIAQTKKPKSWYQFWISE